MIALVIILIILLILVIWAISCYNRLVRLRNDVKEGYSTMDVYLKKRYDLIPNLVETVKGYAKHENGTLEKVIAARNGVANAKTDSDKVEAENVLSGTLKTLFAVSENYPDLKANQNFMDLQSQLNQIEEDIANARRYYNGSAKLFNNACETFPSVLIANMFHFTQYPMYEVNTSEERNNVKVDFSNE